MNANDQMGYCPQCGQQLADADRFCQRCGRARSGLVPASSRRVVKVKNYQYRSAMQRDISKMMEQGWRMEGQAGKFSPAIRVIRNMDHVTVTWVRDVPVRPPKRYTPKQPRDPSKPQSKAAAWLRKYRLI